MSQYTADTIFLCVGLIFFVGAIAWLGVTLHLAYTKMDMMLNHLKNCPAIMNRALFLKSGPWGRLFVLSGITGVLISSNPYLRDGGANAADLKSFPVNIKRKLISLHWICGVLLLTMCALAAYAKFGRG